MNAFLYSNNLAFLYFAVGLSLLTLILFNIVFMINIKRFIFYVRAIWHEMFCRDFDCCRGYHTNNEEFDFEKHTIRMSITH